MPMTTIEEELLTGKRSLTINHESDTDFTAFLTSLKKALLANVRTNKLTIIHQSDLLFTQEDLNAIAEIIASNSYILRELEIKNKNKEKLPMVSLDLSPIKEALAENQYLQKLKITGVSNAQHPEKPRKAKPFTWKKKKYATTVLSQEDKTYSVELTPAQVLIYGKMLRHLKSFDTYDRIAFPDVSETMTLTTKQYQHLTMCLQYINLYQNEKAHLSDASNQYGFGMIGYVHDAIHNITNAVYNNALLNNNTTRSTYEWIDKSDFYQTPLWPDHRIIYHSIEDAIYDIRNSKVMDARLLLKQQDKAKQLKDLKQLNQAFFMNCSLIQLDLCLDDDLTVDEVKEIAILIRSNSSVLRTLSISNNYGKNCSFENQEAFDIFLAALRTNTYLTHIAFNGANHSIKKEQQEEIDKVVSRNKKNRKYERVESNLRHNFRKGIIRGDYDIPKIDEGEYAKRVRRSNYLMNFMILPLFMVGGIGLIVWGTVLGTSLLAMTSFMVAIGIIAGVSLAFSLALMVCDALYRPPFHPQPRPIDIHTAQISHKIPKEIQQEANNAYSHNPDIELTLTGAQLNSYQLAKRHFRDKVKSNKPMDYPGSLRHYLKVRQQPEYDTFMNLGFKFSQHKQQAQQDKHRAIDWNGADQANLEESKEYTIKVKPHKLPLLAGIIRSHREYGHHDKLTSRNHELSKLMTQEWEREYDEYRHIKYPAQEAHYAKPSA